MVLKEFGRNGVVLDRATQAPAVANDKTAEGGTTEKAVREANESGVWIDMLDPTPEEVRDVEERLAIAVPTPAEMQEIEASSRLYEEDGALVMTVPVLNRAATEDPESSAVTFILTRDRLVTLRYIDPAPFRAFVRRAERQPALAGTAEAAMLGLLEQIIDRLADIMEATTSELEGVSRRVFRRTRGKTGSSEDYQEILRRIGQAGDLASKAKDSLLSINRMLLFLSTQSRFRKDTKIKLKTLARDASSITEHANFVANKVTFLLDATLGLINIEQNNIIKIFSVAAVAFLPPTLIASIYGMNFRFMPELNWEAGYPFALGLMVLSAVLPFWYFKRRGWL
jgi:magnesium transporter